MRVLIIKTSSMGDIIHTLPALTDAANAIPNIQFDWVIEESFSQIPTWHPHVNEVIPLAIRRWRKNLFSRQTHQEWQQCRQLLKAKKYDYIIDAQGLLKTVWLVWMTQGLRCGLNWNSAREPFASLFYQKKADAGKIKLTHAVTRMRRLFSQMLGYEFDDSTTDYGINRDKLSASPHFDKPYIVFLHGTTWQTKHWPEQYWIELANLITEHTDLNIKIPWGNVSEQQRAQRIAGNNPRIEVLPRLALSEIAAVLAGAKSTVSVDTGLGHLAAALDVPTVSLYGPTNAQLTGLHGNSQQHLSANYHCSPCLRSQCLYKQEGIHPKCFITITPQMVFDSLHIISANPARNVILN